MGHALFRASLRLHGAFGTPLAGDTLFGQLCWAAREHLGESGLLQLLDGYTEGKPWLVASDGFPAGYLPKPALPQTEVDAEKRKDAKARQWIPREAVGKPLEGMLAGAVSGDTAFTKKRSVEAVQPHNTLNRLTGTTGTGEFAPYTQQQLFFAQDQAMDVYLSLDDDRLNKETLKSLLQAIGMQGYGRDASIGLGKFSVDAVEPYRFPSPASPAKANTFWTLAPCAPQGLGFDAKNSYWRIITRFGRHGGVHALAVNPFKNPVLLAATGALFSAMGASNTLFIGQGLGGKGRISKAESATVHQGYAPVVALNIESRT